MYLRTTKRKNKDGSTVKYYQLAHNERHPETRKPLARIIHNFGRADQVEDEQLIRLCKSIGRVCGLEISDPRINPPGEEATPEEYDNFKIIFAFSKLSPKWHLGETSRVKDEKFNELIDLILDGVFPKPLLVNSMLSEHHDIPHITDILNRLFNRCYQ